MTLPKNIVSFFIILLIVSLMNYSCKNNSQNSSNLTIDPNIKNEVLKHVFNVHELNQKAPTFTDFVYRNNADVEFYENGILIDTKNDTCKDWFHSVFRFDADTANIIGAFGVLSGYGFSIRIFKKKVEVICLMTADEKHGYTATENGQPRTFLPISCKESKVVLSAIPQKYGEAVFGYVEFESNEFYYESLIPSKAFPVKRKAKMKIYFRSTTMPKLPF